jgi:hypothetical protein
MQLHPADTGGSFLEIDFQPGGDDPAGPWAPAGTDWQRARRTDVVDGIVSVDVQSKDPDAAAARWSEITGCDLSGRVLSLDNATINFVEGSLDSLLGVALSATEASRAGERHIISGVAFTLT